jgi:hypothetical protein
VVDLRYHLASLAAVFVALAVGVLLGVAISGKVSDTSESAQRDQISRLSDQLDAERSRTRAAAGRSAAAQTVTEAAYPALMQERLAGKRVAVVFLGSVDGDLRSAIERTLGDGGAGAPLRTLAIKLPLDAARLDRVLAGNTELAAYSGDSDFGDLGRELGRELVAGGDAPALTALQSELVEERSGSTTLPVDGAVVVRSWTPPAADAVDQAQADRSTETLVEGILDGLDSTGVPVVGVESSTTQPASSDVQLYRERGVSSVDDVDTVFGRLALALLLAGGDPGHYGIADSATDGVTPPITPVAAASSQGG